MKWLGPGYFGKDTAPGDEMPKIDEKRLEKFIKQGMVGDIPEKIDIEAINTKKIASLERDLSRAEKKIVALKKTIDSLSAKKKKKG